MGWNLHACGKLKDFGRPTLIIRGEKTQLFYSLTSGSIAKCVQRAKEAVLQNVNHGGPARDPKAFSAAIFGSYPRGEEVLGFLGPAEAVMKLQQFCRSIVAGVIVLGCQCAGADARDYPTRPVTPISPWPPGGANDTLSRLLAEKLSERLGKPIVVENRAGAGSTIGVSVAARAAPDRYTLVAAGPGSRWGQVPVLVDNGRVHLQSAAIVEHLAETLNRLRGADIATRQSVREWLYWDVDALFPPVFGCYGVQLGQRGLLSAVP